MKITLQSKATTLEELRRTITSAIVKPSVIVTVAKWMSGRDAVIEDLQRAFRSQIVIVRSSVRGEDAADASHAGAYRSVAHVSADNRGELEAAIQEVLKSYGRVDPNDEFFVQEQIADVKMAGVVFTKDLDTLAPYYIVNYDDQSGSTASVTSGNTSDLKTFIRFKQSPNPIENFNLRQVITAAKEIEALSGIDALDIEFAITKSEELFILQVRRIVLSGKPAPISESHFAECLRKVHKKIMKLNAPHPGLYGKKAIYSVMTDWNPAEIIGIKPRALALSLYKELVTDAIWAYQRNNYGYKNLRSFPLLISFLGLPYIDVRASLNSFVPAALDEKLTGKLVDYYIDMLVQSPTDHDKVEFNIVFSCYYLNLVPRLKKLLNFGFSELELDRIKFALLNLTNEIISPRDGRYKEDLAKVRMLERKYDEVMDSQLSITDKIYWLIEDCKRYGTLPFAGLARAGFIAVQFLRSFVDLGILTPADLDRFMNSLSTITKELSSDLAALRRGELEEENFQRRYGHLRPGTYDILSRRYDEALDTYFGTQLAEQAPQDHQPFEFTPEQRAEISKRLVDNGIHASFDELMVFIKEAIEGREYSKFLFTRSLSQVLVLMEELGAKSGLTREEVSFIDIDVIVDLYASLSHRDLRDILAENIGANKEAYEIARLVKLPSLITSENHIYDYFHGSVEPNFVTQSRVTQVIVLEEDLLKSDLSNRIVFIRSADPGYDWLFSRKIGGLVTMYGGANSHMAIRCAELSIPAVIGCGERNFSAWGRSPVLEIDCANRQVRQLENA